MHVTRRCPHCNVKDFHEAEVLPGEELILEYICSSCGEVFQDKGEDCKQATE